jgi:DNA-binding beta-propeller fold protein YncE
MVVITVKRIIPFLSVLAMLASACSGDTETTTAPSVVGGTTTIPGALGDTTSPPASPAPEFPDGLDWINVDRPLSFAELRGKVVLLDFWTYGCINCIHIIPDLMRLEEEYPDELVVIGVHSAKFDNEGDTENIRQVVLRYGIEHPVVNDSDFRVWNAWGVHAWPTVALVDPAGNVVGLHSGEGVYEVVEPVIESIVEDFDQRGLIDRSPIGIAPESEDQPDSVLSFPGKVLADAEGGRLFVADTNHHRIVVADLETGEVVQVAGNGNRGFTDGGFAEAQFNQPQGMTLSPDGTLLYVADTGNHAVRTLDLEAGLVATLAGTGEQARSYPPSAGTVEQVELNSPWDLLLDGDVLYVAMAGSHQIWAIQLDSGQVLPVAGSGREGVVNGDAASAQLAQPSGLALLGDRLFFADSESSTIRYLDIGGDVGLLAGSGYGLFDFGDVDGTGTSARLQHPLGVAVADGVLYVADTYNNKIKRIDAGSGETETYLGGEAGWRDGSDALFYEPGGLDAADGRLYVADTNNQAVRVVDLATGDTSTLVLYGVERFAPEDDGFAGTVVRAEPVQLAPGAGTVLVDIGFPPGYKVNDLAPFTMQWHSDGIADFGADAERSIVAPEFPVEVAADFVAGEGLVVGDVTVYYCTIEAQSLCLIDEVRFEIPVEVSPGGAGSVTVSYEVPALAGV